AVLAAEDQRFYQHGGFDWVEVRQAVGQSVQGTGLRGASTISMQAARNLFLWPGRSWVRKGLEAYYTLLLEAFLPKNRILEIYLNVAELGPGLYGAPSGAWVYFGRPASRLSRDQAARLAAILPAPKRLSPLHLSRYLLKRKQQIMNQMNYIELKDWPLFSR
ncbi:MAG: monofunctional biosynthetic peptidoglycan transglycosylase, partial [Pseudomonadota bacterium]